MELRVVVVENIETQCWRVTGISALACTGAIASAEFSFLEEENARDPKVKK